MVAGGGGDNERETKAPTRKGQQKNFRRHITVCRNSTDTRYFQRLRPYPRVHLLRSSIMFKDYDKTVSQREMREGGESGEKERERK